MTPNACTHSPRLRGARDDIGEFGDDRDSGDDRPSPVDPVLLIQMRRPFQLFAPIVERLEIREVTVVDLKFCTKLLAHFQEIQMRGPRLNKYISGPDTYRAGPANHSQGFEDKSLGSSPGVLGQ